MLSWANSGTHVWDRLLRYPKGQRSGLVGDAPRGTRHSIHIERSTNTIPSQIFKRHIDDQVMLPGRPGLRRLKAPFGFTGANSCHSEDAGDLKDVAQKRVIKRTVEPDDERIPSSSLGLG